MAFRLANSDKKQDRRLKVLFIRRWRKIHHGTHDAGNSVSLDQIRAVLHKMETLGQWLRGAITRTVQKLHNPQSNRPSFDHFNSSISIATNELIIV